jgi:hypothetical protein
MPNTSTPSMDLTTLTVPQLKAVCKERRITGYSKLGKAALLQKLTDHSNSGIYTPSSSTTTRTVPQETSRMPIDPVLAIAEMRASVTIKKPRAPKRPKEAVPSSPLSMQQSLSSIPPRDNQLASSSANHGTSQPTPPPIPVVPYEPSYSQSKTALSILKRPASLLNQDAIPEISNKKQKRSEELFAGTRASSTHSQSSNNISARNSVPLATKQFSISMAPPPIPRTNKPQVSPAAKFPACMEPAPAFPKQSPTFLPPPSTPKPTPYDGSVSMQIPLNSTNNTLARIIDIGLKATLRGKRFKPLVLKKGPTSPQSESSREKSHNPTSTSLTSDAQVASSSNVHLHHFDFPLLPFDSLALAPITLPPKLSRRKHVHRWSVILSGLSDEERRQCILVSRLFRYSGEL